ncbi:ribbon-helix-helix domain-containing protein [Niveispirillum fermenti]|uniref:ribbon-helix-helix domain-containing protein n=1 Tax=Niveispirillum fermenti TaxID=1233113 RepID=UPI003A878671
MRKRSVMIAGHPTSVTLEEPFWEALKELAAAEGIAVNLLIERVDATRTGNLSSALRVHVLAAFRKTAAPDPGPIA